MTNSCCQEEFSALSKRVVGLVFRSMCRTEIFSLANFTEINPEMSHHVPVLEREREREER